MPHPGSEADRNQALEYLRSPDRVSRYKAAWPAAAKVATALLAGHFGPIEKYNEHKQPLTSGYQGWGGMQTYDKQAYAWVWWNADGSADFNKGVQGFSLYGLQIESVDLGDGPYWVFFRQDRTYVVSPNYIGGVSPTDTHYPENIEELKALDARVLDYLQIYLQIAKL